MDGFYVGHLDGHPAGRIINNKTGADITWKSLGYTLNDPEGPGSRPGGPAGPASRRACPGAGK